MLNEESHFHNHHHKNNKLEEDSKIDLLDVPLRDDILMMGTSKPQNNQIVLKMRGGKPFAAGESRTSFGGTIGNRRLTGNTTISSNNSLLTNTNLNQDNPTSSKFQFGAKLTGAQGFFTGTLGTMLLNQNDTQ